MNSKDIFLHLEPCFLVKVEKICFCQVYDIKVRVILYVFLCNFDGFEFRVKRISEFAILK